MVQMIKPKMKYREKPIKRINRARRKLMTKITKARIVSRVKRK